MSQALRYPLPERPRYDCGRHNGTVTSRNDRSSSREAAAEVKGHGNVGAFACVVTLGNS